MHSKYIRKELFIKCFGFRRVALNSDLLVCAPLLLPMCLVKERKEAWKLVLMHFLLPFVIILQLGEQFWFNLMLTQKEIRCYRARMMGEKSAQSMWSEKRQRSLKTRMNMLDMCKFFMHANFYLWLPFFPSSVFSHLFSCPFLFFASELYNVEAYCRPCRAFFLLSVCNNKIDGIAWWFN